MRTERKGRRTGLLAILAVLAVLAVVGALAAPNLFGGNESAGSSNSGEDKAQLGGNEGRSGGEQGGGGGGPGSDQGSQGGGASPSATASASAGPSPSPQSSSSPVAAGDVPEKGVFTASAAEDTVQAFYTMTSDGKYDGSARLLSEDWRQSTFPNRDIFEGTFDKVESVDFIEGPDARVSGNEATVTGETHARLKGKVEHNKGTWYLVREDGRWKIDGWDVVKLSSQPT